MAKRRGRTGLVADREAIVGRKEYEQGKQRGVGFAHLFMRKSELFVDRLMLGGLGVEPEGLAPYVVDSPRHITSVPMIRLDPIALQYLQIGRDAERLAFEESMRLRGYDASVRKAEHYPQIIDIHALGGRTLIAEVDCAQVSMARQNLEKVFSEAGVPIPAMHAPHFKVGVADTFSDFKDMQQVAREVLVGEVVAVEPIDAYFNTYTEEIRPEHVPTGVPV